VATGIGNKKATSALTREDGLCVGFVRKAAKDVRSAFFWVNLAKNEVRAGADNGARDKVSVKNGGRGNARTGADRRLLAHRVAAGRKPKRRRKGEYSFLRSHDPIPSALPTLPAGSFAFTQQRAAPVSDARPPEEKTGDSAGTPQNHPKGEG
jgi:hypothetical protein